MKVLLDTNILLRHGNKSDPRSPAVAASLERYRSEGSDLCIWGQNLIEFWAVATRPVKDRGFGESPRDARRMVDGILRTYVLVHDPADLLPLWLDLCTKHSVKGRQAHDARLAALMLSVGIGRLVTLNPKDFKRYAHVIALDPTDPSRDPTSS